jgi:hypothetical protein
VREVAAQDKQAQEPASLLLSFRKLSTNIKATDSLCNCLKPPVAWVVACSRKVIPALAALSMATTIKVQESPLGAFLVVPAGTKIQDKHLRMQQL